MRKDPTIGSLLPVGGKTLDSVGRLTWEKGDFRTMDLLEKQRWRAAIRRLDQQREREHGEWQAKLDERRRRWRREEVAARKKALWRETAFMLCIATVVIMVNLLVAWWLRGG